MTHPALYRGRFAPSPTGPLHFGSLIAALASFLDARANQGSWLLRVEDIDPPREQSGAREEILHALDAYGLHWDEDVVYQSSRLEAYQEALDFLEREQLLYACSCSRRDIAKADLDNLRSLRYPGTCRNTGRSASNNTALRVRTREDETGFTDRIFGRHAQRLESEIGDFVVRRRDGLIAYHLAVVVDDAWQGITDIIRGSDLLDSTPRQIYLQQVLGYSTPDYLHIPVATNARREKLSKQTGATALSLQQVNPTLIRALEFLNQAPDRQLGTALRDDILKWAIDHWNPGAISAVEGIVVNKG